MSVAVWRSRVKAARTRASDGRSVRRVTRAPGKHSKSYTVKAQAEGRRSELMAALRKGEQFDVETGPPASALRALNGSVTWYEHTRAYVEGRWDRLPPTPSRPSRPRS